jgi:hypothetical protein
MKIVSQDETRVVLQDRHELTSPHALLVMVITPVLLALLLAGLSLFAGYNLSDGGTPVSIIVLLIIATIFGAVWYRMVRSAHVVTVSSDRAVGTITIERRNQLATEQKQLAVSEIVAIDLASVEGGYHLVALLTGYSRVVLIGAHGVFNDYTPIAQAVSEFLKVPLVTEQR